MKKRYDSTYGWCRQACSHIIHPSDREKVMRELEGHFEDRIAELQESGMSYQEALRRAEAAMGDPDEVGVLLRQVHKPWIHYLLIAARLLLVLCVLAAWTLYTADRDPWQSGDDPSREAYSEVRIEAEARGCTFRDLTVDAGFARAGYTVRLERVLIAESPSERFLLAEVYMARSEPWQDSPMPIGEHITVTDGEGNVLTKINWGARSIARMSERRYFCYELPETVSGPLWLRYDFGSVHEQIEIGGADHDQR